MPADRELTQAAQASLGSWLEMFSTRDLRELPSIIASEAVFHSPVGMRPYPGRDVACLVLRTAAGVFDDFRYERIGANGDTAFIEFSARIADVALKGVHILRFDTSGAIIDIEKFVRPSEAAILLGDTIGDRAGEKIKALRG